MIINKKSETKKLKNNILALGAEANKAKLLDNEVINATSGMLKNDDGSLYEFNSVNKVINSLSTSQKFAYSTTTGTPNFKKAIYLSIFGQYFAEVSKKAFLSCAATPGGTGALNLTFTNYVDANEIVLFPNHMWENYLAIAEEIGFVAQTYHLFNDDGQFDIDDLNYQIAQIKDQQKRLVIVLNDPCQNPTGFSMSDNDYDALISIANNNPNNDFVFLLDVAYFDFYNTNPNIIRSRFAKLANIPNNAIAMFAYSGSKSFGLYGLRIGALVMLSKNEDEINVFNNAIAFSCRTKWSNSSALGISIIDNLVLNEQYNALYEEEIKYVCAMLEERSIAFLKKAKEINLKTLPYEKGFFICIPCKDPEKMMNALHQDKVYLICTKNCIRVALCAINKAEAERLPKLNKNRLDILDI